jgi:hypothetical protein
MEVSYHAGFSRRILLAFTQQSPTTILSLRILSFVSRAALQHMTENGWPVWANLRCTSLPSTVLRRACIFCWTWSHHRTRLL